MQASSGWEATPWQSSSGSGGPSASSSSATAAAADLYEPDGDFDPLSPADLKVCRDLGLDRDAMAALRVLAGANPQAKARLLTKLLVKGPEVRRPSRFSAGEIHGFGIWVLQDRVQTQKTAATKAIPRGRMSAEIDVPLLGALRGSNRI